MQILTLWVLYS